MVNEKRTADDDPPESRGESNGRKPAKRSRVSRACDACRSARERCDGEQRCQTCISQHRTCTYNAQPKKRGIQPNYIRTLELTLAWLFHTFPEAETQLAESLPQEHQRITQLLRGRDSEASEALHSSWRDSIICKQIDQLLSGDLIDAQGRRLADQTVIDATSSNRGPVPYTSPPLSAPLEQNVLQHSGSDREITSDSLYATAFAQVSPRSLPPNHGLVDLPQNALTLLEHYFAFTHSWLPMTEKHSLLKLLYSYPSGGLRCDQIVAAEHAELWSIMALAALQLSNEANQEQVYQIRKTAESLIPALDTKVSFEIPHIRAMMLLALIDISQERILAAWLRIGTVVSVLLLFRVLEKLNITAKWCRHIHLAAFLVENAIASHLRVPAHLRVSYIEAIGLVDEDGIDEWAPWNDPLDTDRQHGQAKTPARSFSTLNELLRRTMVSPSSGFTGGPNESGSASADGSIVFSLLQNASRERGRVQPSVLVAAYGNYTNNIGPGTQSSPPGDVNTGKNLAHSPALDSEDWGPQRPVSSSEAQDLPGFMSIPHDSNNFPTLSSVTVDQSAPALWTSSPSISQSADFAYALADGSTGVTDIFEQFDALLERQDSTQHSQFYQNLGFAPDVELAEFFGNDFIPSDPLLAYLNPTLYGTKQSGG